MLWISEITFMELRKIRNESELVQVHKLLEENLKQNLSYQERKQQGFITINYSLNSLIKLNKITPTIVAIDESKVIGYALSANRNCKGLHKFLDMVIAEVDKTFYNKDLLLESDYVVVGQLCVAKAYRRRGVSQKIYQEFKQEFHQTHPYCLTGVDALNKGSIESHKKCGFRVLKQLKCGLNSIGYLLIWDWRI